MGNQISMDLPVRDMSVSPGMHQKNTSLQVYKYVY